MTVVVIDYSRGNLRSVQKGLERAGTEALVSSRVDDIRRASALVLPGVGSFADASRELCASGQMQALRERISQGIPFLGICLGMQLLFEGGIEGIQEGTDEAPGLGVFSGHCIRVAATDSEKRHYKVPHVGWNQVDFTPQAHRSESCMMLFEQIPDGSDFYFTHSYQSAPKGDDIILATTTHARVLPSVVGRGRVFGVQFHPEKSSQKGLTLLRNFVRFARGTS